MLASSLNIVLKNDWMISSAQACDCVRRVCARWVEFAARSC